MPDIGFLELILIGVIAFLVLGPERMPELFGQVGRVVRKGRSWIADVKRQIDAESAPLTTEVAGVRDSLSDIEINNINEEIMKKHGQKLSPAGDDAACEDTQLEPHADTASDEKPDQNK